MTTRPRKTVPAKVVEVDPAIEPVEAEIVADKRPNLGKRLGIFAATLLVLFFVINGYVQSAKNGNLLHRAAVDRSKLVQSVSQLTKSNAAQTKLIKRLQNALRKQNQLLEENGVQTVIVPSSNSSTSRGESDFQKPPSGDKQASNDRQKKHHHHKKPGDGHKPPPDKDPVDKVTDRVCELTGICVTRSDYVAYHQQQGLRRSEVHRTSWSTSSWWVILRIVADVGLASWG